MSGSGGHIFLAVAGIAIFASSNGQYHDGFTHQADFGVSASARNVNVFWTPGEKDEDYIRFEISANTKGWMGLGFSPTGAMTGADIIVMWIDANGIPRISDRHGPTDEVNGFPPEDEQQDYEILWANETTTKTTFQIRRRMATCDVNDWTITMDTVRLLFAYNDEKPPQGGLNKHSDHFSRSIHLLGPDDRQRVQGILHGPDIYTTVDFSSGGFEMLVQDGNQAFVHHMLLYACGRNMSQYLGKPESCYDGEQQFMNYCNDVFGGWAVGGEAFAYPNDMGIRYFGEEYDYFSAEFHFDNSKYVPNIIDNSTFRIYLTDKLRPTEIGKLNLGSDSNAFSIVIPPQQESFTHYSYCPAECSNNLGNNAMTIMSGFLHSHLAGRAIRVRHLRNGIELPPIIVDNHYDFNYQAPMIFEPRQFIAGDELIVECQYNTMDRNRTTTGGLSTHHEMCLALFEYYPRNRFLEQRCMSVINRPSLPYLLGAQATYGMGDPDYTWVLDAQGRNRTYVDWVETIDWTANGGRLINKLQNYVRDTPQGCVCKLSNATQVNDDYYFEMFVNPKPTSPYAPPPANCRQAETVAPTSTTDVAMTTSKAGGRAIQLFLVAIASIVAMNIQ